MGPRATPGTRENLGEQQTRENSLKDKVEVARSIAQHREEITSINLHAFGYARSCSLCHHISTDGGITRTCVSKVHIAKGRTYPTKIRTSVRAHSSHLVDNIKALQGFPVGSVYCWLDSSIALHWIKGEETSSNLLVIK